MTEDERRQAEEQERLQAQAKRDLDLTIKGLKLDVVDAVQEMGLDAGFRNLIAVEDLATIADEDERKAKLTERVKGMKSSLMLRWLRKLQRLKLSFSKDPLQLQDLQKEEMLEKQSMTSTKNWKCKGYD